MSDRKEVAMETALSPGEYDIVQTVFNTLTQAEWFDRNPDNEKACAAFVLLQYGQGGISVDELLARCEDVAIERFSRRH
jgi:hypothetical protein